MFVLDAENFKKARVTLLLILLNVICFIVFNYDLNPELFYMFVQINYNIIYNLEIWRLLTSMFLHADVIHLFSNMLGLLIFGAFLEQTLKTYEFIIVYFVSGLIGSLFSLLLLPLNVISLGASGAIFGLLGVSFIVILREGDKVLLIVGIVYLAYFILSSFAPGINLFAHLFGLLGGIILGYFFTKKNVREY